MTDTNTTAANNTHIPTGSIMAVMISNCHIKIHCWVPQCSFHSGLFNLWALGDVALIWCVWFSSMLVIDTLILQWNYPHVNALGSHRAYANTGSGYDFAIEQNAIKYESPLTKTYNTLWHHRPQWITGHSMISIQYNFVRACLTYPIAQRPRGQTKLPIRWVEFGKVF